MNHSGIDTQDLGRDEDIPISLLPSRLVCTNNGMPDCVNKLHVTLLQQQSLEITESVVILLLAMIIFKSVGHCTALSDRESGITCDLC